jgi:alpha-amylase
MSRQISLALVIHNHQPVGNFGWVIEDVFERAYEPMIGALERHPGVRLGLHYSGPLLEWMDVNRPEALDRLRALVERKQVEIMGGGYFEPILVSLPERDRMGQLLRMRDEIERRFGVAPAGAWLAERVWEPSLPTALVDAGYAYTVLDDNHLRSASVPADEMWGTYTTDDEGRRLTIFGTEKGLRYRIPWRPVDELIGYLRRAATDAGDRLGIMGDDGEKFGGWPGTDKLCWGPDGWIDECFTALGENSDWLATVTPSGWMTSHPPIGRVYLPTSSYVEMTEWALPADEAPVFHHLLEEAVAAESPAARFLRGGMWRNFQARYREVNDLHKQMLRVSAAVDAMPAGELRDRALEHLYRGQSNDCYWHGLFGGIYIVHMRMATLAELIAAEDLASGSAPLSGVADYDLDGVDEVLIGTPGQSVLIDIAEGAGIGSWDLRASRVALASVMRRRPEAYHQQLLAAEAGGGATPGATVEVTNPHEDVRVKEPGLTQYLFYDDHERRSGLVRVLGKDGAEVGDFVNGAWELEQASESSAVLVRTAGDLTVRKRVVVDGGRLEGSLSVGVEVVYSSDRQFAGELELEWNVNLMGGGGNTQAYYRWATDDARHDTDGAVKAGVGLSFGNEYEGVDIAAEPEPPAAQEWLSVDTVSNSEAGFERMHQGSCLIQRWPLSLAAGESRSFSTTLRITQSRDRS